MLIENIFLCYAQNTFMKTSTKVWLILTIISNIALFYFFRPMIDAIKFGAQGIYFEFTWESYVGIAMFVLANIAGTICFIRFIRSQPLNRQIFFSTIPPTVTFVFLMLFFFTITIREQTDIVTAVRAGLGIADKNASYIWMIIIVLIYSIYLYLTYTNLAKPVRKIERAVEVLRNGKTKKPIKVGNNKQFQGIEYDLNQINENYKQQEKILKELMPDKDEITVEENKVVETITPKKERKRSSKKTS